MIGNTGITIFVTVYFLVSQPGVPGGQGAANAIGQPQMANKIVAWTGVLEWQEVKQPVSFVNHVQLSSSMSSYS